MAQSTTKILLKTLLLIFTTCMLASCDFRDRFDAKSFDCLLAKNATISYQNNLNLLFADFIAQSSLKGYYNASFGDGIDAVYGYYLCRGDISSNACHNCILNGTKFAQDSNCKHQDGMFYSGKCMFRYSNHSMYKVWEQSFVYSFDFHPVNVSNYQQFNRTLSASMESLINDTAFGDDQSGFATKEATVSGDEKIYSLAQCTPDIVGINCTCCLTKALSVIQGCCNGYQTATVMFANCRLRYDNQSFYDNPGTTVPSNGESLRSPNLQLVYSSLFLVMFYAYFLTR